MRRWGLVVSSEQGEEEKVEVASPDASWEQGQSSRTDLSARRLGKVWVRRVRLVYEGEWGRIDEDEQFEGRVRLDGRVWRRDKSEPTGRPFVTPARRFILFEFGNVLSQLRLREQFSVGSDNGDNASSINTQLDFSIL